MVGLSQLVAFVVLLLSNLCIRPCCSYSCCGTLLDRFDCAVCNACCSTLLVHIPWDTQNSTRTYRKLNLCFNFQVLNRVLVGDSTNVARHIVVHENYDAKYDTVRVKALRGRSDVSEMNGFIWTTILDLFRLTLFIHTTLKLTSRTPLDIVGGGDAPVDQM